MAVTRTLQALVVVLLLPLLPGTGFAERKPALRATADLLLGVDARPFAIAHRGFGENRADPTRPIENTVAAVRAGFAEGASVVEVDAQLTRDLRAVLFHDDRLSDGTCLNRLTLAELRAHVPHVATLGEALAVAREFNQASDPLRGIVIVEIKSAAPPCDPHDVTERVLVAAVVHDVRRAKMTRQVLLTSFSPALLYFARRQAPEIDRILAVSGLQLLTEEQIETALGLPVTPIAKRVDLGLQWAEVGDVYRLPGYRSFEELLETAVLTGARVLEADTFLLRMAGKPFVDLLQATGLKVFGFTAKTEVDWDFLESLGVDGIYTDDVPMGLVRQAPIP